MCSLCYEKYCELWSLTEDLIYTVVEAIVAFMSVWSVIGLAGFHSYLACCNVTTNEDVSMIFLSRSVHFNPLYIQLSNEHINPFGTSHNCTTGLM